MCVCVCVCVYEKWEGIWVYLWDWTEKAMAPHSSTLAWKIPWMEEPGKLQSMGSREESDTTERLHFHFSLSCFGEGNGNRLQCSCLENPRDGGAWWAAVYGVAQSQTWLKRLSSSSSMGLEFLILFGSAWTFLHIVSMMTSNRFGFKSSGCLPYKLQKVTYLFHWFENINIKYIT